METSKSYIRISLWRIIYEIQYFSNSLKYLNLIAEKIQYDIKLKLSINYLYLSF